MKTHYLTIDLTVQVSYEIKAESLEDALAKAKEILPQDCVKTAKRNVSINDWEISGISGVWN